jgi:hypothetical protein
MAEQEPATTPDEELDKWSITLSHDEMPSFLCGLALDINGYYISGTLEKVILCNSQGSRR